MSGIIFPHPIPDSLLYPNELGNAMANPLIHLRNQHLGGKIGGMVAVCSSHPMVLQAAMELAAAERSAPAG